MSAIATADEGALRRHYLFRPCQSMEELHDWVIVYLDIDFPDAIVDVDSNSSPMHALWEVYSKCLAVPGEDEGSARYLMYAARSTFKTLVMAVLEVLSLLHLGRDVGHMAAIEGQAEKAQSYVKEAFRRPYLRDFVVGDNVRSMRLVRYYNSATAHSITSAEYAILADDDRGRFTGVYHYADYDEKARYVKVVICSLSGSNSDHVPLFVVDEIDVISNTSAFEEAKSIPSGRDGMIPVSLMGSTRKSSVGLVQKEIDNAQKSGLKIRHWNIIDVTAACQPKRHLPDLPRLTLYRSDEYLHHIGETAYAGMTDKEREMYARDDAAYAGCATCRLYPMCRGLLASKQTSTSNLLIPIAVTIDTFSDKDLDYAKAQLLCRRPSQKGKIYPRFDKSRHVLTPAQAYERVFGEAAPESLGGRKMTKSALRGVVVDRGLEWQGGMDFGDEHDFAAPVGFKDGRRAFVMYSPGGSDLDPFQQVEICQVFKDLNPSIWPDVANKGMTKIFKSAGFSLRATNKGAGSVASGISIVKRMLSPIGDPDPHLFFVVDVDPDPGMDVLIDQMQDYSWALDAAGNPTGQPKKVYDDYVDALRYWLFSVFAGGRAGLVVSTERDLPGGGVSAQVSAPQMPSIDESFRTVVAQTIGVPVTAEVRQGVRIEAPKGSGYTSYYSDSDDVGGAKSQQSRGKRGNLQWNIG